MRRLFWVLLSCGAACLRAAGPGAADFARLEEFSRAQISSDGKHVGLFHRTAGRLEILVHDLATNKARVVGVGFEERTGEPSHRFGLDHFVWVGPRRLLVFANFVLPATNPLDSYSGVSAVDLDGKNWTDLPGLAPHPERNYAGEVDLVWDRTKIFLSEHEPNAIYVHAWRVGWTRFPDALRIDTIRATTKPLFKNPGTITDWIFDETGEGVGVAGAGDTAQLLTRDPSSGEWRPAGDLGWSRARIVFHDYDAATGKVYASVPGPQGTQTLQAFDLKEKRWSEPLLQHPRYDVVPTAFAPQHAGEGLTGPFFSPKTHRILGVGLVADGPRQQWFDDRFVAVQRALNAAAPDLFHQITDIDQAEARVVCFSWSAREPGFYSVVDLATGKTTRLAQRMSWIKAGEMGRVSPVKFKARDGMELDAYVTLPPGSNGRGLPLVLLLREEPWAREVWSFNPLAQMLATRGCAVLQVNYRGSSGYGEAFARLGRDAVAGVVHDDLIDGVRWAVEKGIAAPDRIAAVGSAFGGYLALSLARREPELIRSVVAIDAVADWVEVLRSESSAAHRHWLKVDELFRAERKEEKMRDMSPVSWGEKIRQPVLLVHHVTDPFAPADGIRKFAASASRAGRVQETFFYGTGWDPAEMEKKRGEAYARIETFLARHLTLAPASAAVTP